MGFWPFGGGGKRQRVVEAQDTGRDTLLRRTPSDRMSRLEKVGDVPTTTRDGSEAKHDNTVSKDSRPYAAQPSKSEAALVKAAGARSRRASRANSQYTEKNIYQQNPLSQSSLGPENFTAVLTPPTLYAKRTDDSQLSRRKSSKRKAEDHAREQEIKAMSSSPIPIPKRPATLYGTGPLQRDSRQIPGALNRRLERPNSEVSLPMPDSLPDIDDISNQNSFKVGMLAALSPRPTVRYDSQTRIGSGKQSVRHNVAIQRAIVEEDTSDKKCINELADDLDANGLRELMERDRRRREKKKESDRLKLQRKLQRRAERQREEEERRARTEAYVRESPHGSNRGGTDVGPTNERPRTAKKREAAGRNELKNEDPFADDVGPSAIVSPTPIRNPFEDENEVEATEGPLDIEEEGPAKTDVGHASTWTQPPEETSPPQKISQHTISPPTSPIHRPADRSSISQGSASLLGREVTPDIPENTQLERRISDQSSQRLSSWTTFFKRGTRRKYAPPSQGRTTPSEFSNASRESFQRKQPPPIVTPRTFRRTDTTVPQRTMSRFREDLPELPMSPPDSRMQSPETTVPSASASQPRGNVASNLSPITASALISREATLSPTELATPTQGPYQKRSFDLEDPDLEPQNAVLSQSLASVGSEASWLSGRPAKRVSGTGSAHPLKQSASSPQQPMPGAFDQRGDDGDDEDDVADDDYYNRLNPASPERRGSATNTERKASSTLIDLQRERQASDVPEVPALPAMIDEMRHGSVAQRPMIVQQAGRARSKEGLLKEYTAGEAKDSDSEDNTDVLDVETPGAEMKDTPLLRATSVEYKGHARHISAGSAKLLDIKRSSTASDMNVPRSPTLGRRPEGTSPEAGRERSGS